MLATRRGEMTTADLVGVERGLIAAAQGRAGEGAGRVDEQTLGHALASCEREMTGEQRRVVHATVTSGRAWMGARIGSTPSASWSFWAHQDSRALPFRRLELTKKS